jgi:hypothetical protein
MTCALTDTSSAETASSATISLRERIFPVFGTKYKPRTALTSARDLLSERLLHLSGIYPAEARWAHNHWFQLQGLPVPEERSGTHVNTYLNMLQAAVEGQGIALAGPPLVDDLLASGTLIQMPSVRPPRAGILLRPQPQPPKCVGLEVRRMAIFTNRRSDSLASLTISRCRLQPTPGGEVALPGDVP